MKWKTEERCFLFAKLAYVDSSSVNLTGAMAKIGSVVECGILQRLLEEKKRLGDFVHPTGRGTIYYTRKLSYYVQILDFVPRIIDGRGKTRLPSELKQIDFESSSVASVYLAVLNSSLSTGYCRRTPTAATSTSAKSLACLLTVGEHRRVS